MPSILRTLLINSFNDNPTINIIVSPLLSPPDDLNKPKALNSSNAIVIEVKSMQGGTGGPGGPGINGSGGSGRGDGPSIIEHADTAILYVPLLAPPDSDTALVPVAQLVAIAKSLKSQGDDNDVSDFAGGEINISNMSQKMLDERKSPRLPNREPQRWVAVMCRPSWRNYVFVAPYRLLPPPVSQLPPSAAPKLIHCRSAAQRAARGGTLPPNLAMAGNFFANFLPILRWGLLILLRALMLSDVQPSLHFDGSSTQACAEVARHTWTHLDLGRPCRGLLKVFRGSLGLLDLTMLSMQLVFVREERGDGNGRGIVLRRLRMPSDNTCKVDTSPSIRSHISRVILSDRNYEDTGLYPDPWETRGSRVSGAVSHRPFDLIDATKWATGACIGVKY
ncbi:hypothetical protein DFH08DRAFT_933761 [Mycena albidolilacea]|uniref:Uncharacterized protein n=1 Tax=Mycena albidolilacea TaxID=1033008 RepID=A0AAD7ABX2_9AGAR|nr:hypothetical protein DFH08DRAFT_933761 [Mycena albidolilacea]